MAFLNKFSDKGKQEIEALNKVYEEIGKERIHVCSGCGIKYNLSHSHIISRSKRKDLELEKENIVYDCLGTLEKKGCHSKWESGNIEEMMALNNFEERLLYISKVDRRYFYYLLFKIEKVNKDYYFYLISMVDE